MRDESEQAVIHRLEAFSDIVIGFSLAQLGLSLTFPKHTIDLFTHVKGASGLLALVITFTLVCLVWWLHHRLFRHLFVPTTPNIILNFAALCGVIFLAYSMQLLVHFGPSDPLVFPMYTGSYAWILLLFSIIAWDGLRRRNAELHGDVLLENRYLAVRTTAVGIYLVILTAAMLVFGPQSQTAQTALIGTVPLVLVLRLWKRRMRAATLPSRGL